MASKSPAYCYDTRYFILEEDWAKMKLKEPGRYKALGQDYWQQPEYARLYSYPQQAFKLEFLIAFDNLQSEPSFLPRPRYPDPVIPREKAEIKCE